MELDPTVCYRALKSRDARFDGRFFVAVKTTGVFCRPVCPARTPKRENVRFYACAAAAEEAGFRPCLRCRPETSPGTPAWLGTSATVSRALRLIGEGILDEHGVAELSRRLGVGDRHLRRLFDEHLGASPVAVAQSRRVLFAKNLIDETALPLTEIAFASGFSSVRRFNAAFRATYGRAPREIRRVRGNGHSDGSGGDVTLKLAYRPPYDWEAMVGFLGTRAIPGIETVEDGRYRRAVSLGGVAGVIEASHDDEGRHVVLRVPTELSPGLPAIVERMRRLFDLKADPATIAEQLGRDPILERSIKRRPGLRVPGAWDSFEAAVRAVLGQHVSVKGARTLCGRLVERYGERLPMPQGAIEYLFPEPERLARARMNGIGVTGKRIETIRGLARAVLRGEVALATSVSLEDAVETLTALPGIGAWTAHYIAMRAMGEPDAFPSGDLGVRKACEKLLGRETNEKDVLGHAERWRPWRAYATMHLWSSLG